MSENIGFTDSKDSVHCKKTCLYATFWLTWSSACANFDSFEHNFPLLRIMRRVSTSCINCETWQCAIFHQNTLFCSILTYEDVFRCKFSHRRTCMFATCHIIFKNPSQYATFHIRNHVRSLVWPTRRTVMCIHCEKPPSAQRFDLHGRVRMQIFSWEDVSSHVSHNFICLGSTDMFPRNVSTRRRVYARVHTLKDGCLLTFWVTKSFLCVTLNIWHHVGHQILHRQVETMYNRMT